MALTLGTHDLDSAPTPITAGRKGRKTKSIEEQVAEADAIPYVERAHADFEGEPAPDPELVPLVLCTCPAVGDDWEPVPDCPRHGEDTGELEMTPEQMAEFRSRARMGLGGPQEAPESRQTFVTDYDAKGEAIDVTVPPRAPQQPETPTVIRDQYVMPMFEALRMDKLVLNVAGRVELNYALKHDRDLWDDLRPGETVEFIVTALVPSRGPRIKFDSEREISEKAGVAAAKVVEVRPVEFREKIVHDDHVAEIQVLINWAHQLLAGDYSTDDTIALLHAVADLGEPSASAPMGDALKDLIDSDSDIVYGLGEDGTDADDNPVASALDEALAAAMEGDEE